MMCYSTFNILEVVFHWRLSSIEVRLNFYLHYKVHTHHYGILDLSSKFGEDLTSGGLNIQLLIFEVVFH